MKKSAEELDIMGERRGMHIIDPVLERTCPVCGTVCNHRLSHTRRGGIVSCDNLACRATYCSYRTPQWIVDLPEIYRPSLLMDANPVAAIKHVRTHTGLGLKDAKDVVDRLRGNTMFGERSDAAYNVWRQITDEGVTRL